MANEEEVIRTRGTRIYADFEKLAVMVLKYRIRQGLSQRELGERWGVSRWTIIRIERGRKVTPMTAYKCFNKLAQALEREGGNA